MYEQFAGQRRTRSQNSNNPFIYSELWPTSVFEKNPTHALAERCCVLVEAKFLRPWREKGLEQFSCRCIGMAQGLSLSL